MSGVETMEEGNRIFQIQSRYFVAGGVLENGKVTLTAPILRYMRGWSENKVVKYCFKKHWQVNRSKIDEE